MCVHFSRREASEQRGSVVVGAGGRGRQDECGRLAARAGACEGGRARQWGGDARPQRSATIRMASGGARTHLSAHAARPHARLSAAARFPFHLLAQTRRSQSRE